MIPSTTAFLEQEFEIKEQPTHTHRIRMQFGQVCGCTDEADAMKQAIYKILLTERFQYIIYSDNYGIETMDLYGQPVSYICPELKRRITEALTQDSRIKSVDNFEFDFPQKGVIYTTFTVHTVFGDIPAGKEVNF